VPSSISCREKEGEGGGGRPEKGGEGRKMSNVVPFFLLCVGEEKRGREGERGGGENRGKEKK